MLAPSVNEWMNEWLWCIEAQKCKRAWLDGKIQLDIRDQQEGQNPGEGGWASGSAKKTVYIMLCWRVGTLSCIWEGLKQFSQHGDSNLSFFPNVLLCMFSITYKIRENSPNGPLCTHYPASTVSNIFPFLFHLSHFLWSWSKHFEANPSIMPFLPERFGFLKR